MFDTRMGPCVLTTILHFLPWFVGTASAQADPFQADIAAVQVREVENARVLLRGGDAAAAANVLEKTLATNPSYYRAQYNLGIALLAEGEYSKAVVALEGARRIREEEGLTEPTLFNSLGWAYYLAGDFEKAEKAYLQGVELVGQNSASSNQKLFNNLGVLYTRLGRLGEAEIALKRARDEFGSDKAQENLMIVKRVMRVESQAQSAPPP